MNKHFIILAFLTVVTKVVSLLRQSLIISLVGVNAISDAYFNAFRLPDLIYNIFVMGTLLPAFIPIFATLFGGNKKESYRYVSSLVSIFSIFIFVVSFIVLIFSRSLMKFLVPGFTEDVFDITLQVTRVLLITPLIFTLSTFVSGVLNTLSSFTVTAFAPLVYNVSIIVGTIFVFPKFGIIGLAWCVVFGAFLHFLTQVIFLFYKHKFVFNFNIRYTQDIKKTFALMFPRLLAFDSAIAALSIASVFGSIHLLSGQLAIYNVVLDLAAVPVGIIALSGTTVAFPKLASVYANKQVDEYLKNLRYIIGHSLLLLLPSAVYMLLLSEQIVRIVFGREGFTWSNTFDGLEQLGVLTFGVVSYGLVTILTRAFYARKDTVTPVIANMAGVVANLIIVYFFIEKIGLFALSIGFVASIMINSIVLSLGLYKSIKVKDGASLIDSYLSRVVWSSVLGCIVMGAITVCVQYLFAFLFGTNTLLLIILQSIFSVLVSFPFYLFVLDVFGIKELKYITIKYFLIK